MGKTQSLAAYAQRSEMLFQAYAQCFDLEIASRRIGLSQEERERMRGDVELQARLDLVLFDEQEREIKVLRELSGEADNEGVRLTATIKLGEMLYKSRFKPAGGGFGSAPMVPDKIVLEGVE